MGALGKNDNRQATAIRFELGLYKRMVEAAGERQVSLNWLINAGMTDFMDRLIPVEEMRLTRETGSEK